MIRDTGFGSKLWRVAVWALTILFVVNLIGVIASGNTARVDVAEVGRIHQPTVWTNAVASGRIKDPGVTARGVSAMVTRTSAAGTQRFSVAVSLNLEGPPVRTAYGVVGVITFSSIPVGPS